MSRYKVGDKFEIEIEDVLTNEKGEVLYRIKPFAALTFNDYGLNMLKQIIPETDWSKVKVDTPILVSDDNISWYRRHFARCENDKVYAFDGDNTITKVKCVWENATPFVIEGECEKWQEK